MAILEAEAVVRKDVSAGVSADRGGREGIPDEAGARKDSRTSEAQGIPAEVGARRESRTSGVLDQERR